MKYPKKIPWSMIDTDKLRQDIERYKREEEKRNWKPYVDLTERKERAKDHSKVFKDIYKGVEADLKSGDAKRQSYAQLKLVELLKVYSGRTHTQKELYNIIIHCEQKKPRYKINAFGELYMTKEINPFNDIDHK